MFELYDRVIELGTDIRGVVIDIDNSTDKPYGVLFEDMYENIGVWWCDSDMIEKDVESTYNVADFIESVNSRSNGW